MEKVTIHTLYAGNDITGDQYPEVSDVVVFAVEKIDTHNFVHVGLTKFGVEIWCSANGYEVVDVGSVYELTEKGWQQRASTNPTTRFLYNVYIECETAEQADTVIAERLDYDEQYEDENGVKFDYRIGLV